MQNAAKYKSAFECYCSLKISADSVVTDSGYRNSYSIARIMELLWEAQ
jgi:hypothetical protein